VTAGFLASTAAERLFVFLMLSRIQRQASDIVQQRGNDYLRTLIAPMDGMWEGAVIAQAAFWELQDRGQYAGYYCIDRDNVLLRFHLLEKYHDQAQAVFGWVISTHGIAHAVTSTIEPFYFSLCLDVQTGISIHSFMFRDSMSSEPSPPLGQTVVFKQVQTGELPALVHFYRNNTEGSKEWIENFLRTLVGRNELFALYNGQVLVAAGECIPSQYQKPYADLGMIVDRSHRRRGIGTSMLLELKGHCYESGLKPICSCAADNTASKKAIEKAGFISEQRMVRVSFSEDHQRE